MTPVAPGLQLSSEANAIVAAINGALALRLDGIQGQMEMLAGQMPRAGSSPTDQSSCGTLGIARKRKAFLFHKGFTVDQSSAYSGGGEGLLDEWSRDGHRRRLGAGPCVVQKTEDGGSGHHV